MKNFDPKKINSLLAEGKKAEAKKYLSDFLDDSLKGEGDGKALLDYSRIYMEAMNEVNRVYKSELDEIIAELKELNKNQKENDDKLKLASVRAGLN